MFPTALRLEGDGIRREKLETAEAPAASDLRRRAGTTVHSRENASEGPSTASPSNEFDRTDRYALAQPLFHLDELSTVRS